MKEVFDIAARRAALTPERIAMIEVASGKALTYRTLNERAARFAAALAELGIARGDRVAILGLNSATFFEVLFACGKAGAILVPLNWRQPVAELTPVLQDSGAGLLIHDAAHAGVAGELGQALGISLLSHDDYEQVVAGTPPGAFDTAWPSDGVWYVLYTSGTTGKPKAVIQTFGMAYINCVNIGQAIDLTSRDSTINFLPLFHTAGINLHTLPVLIAGGTVRVLEKFDVDQVLALLGGGQCTVFFGVPAVYQAIGLHADFAATDLSRVRSWGCGGAPLPASLIERLARRGVQVCNGFGMTETGPTAFLMDTEHAAAKIGSVGKPQILVEARIVDHEGRDVPDGQAGELLLRGPGITPGYWQNPDATRAAFTADGWLRTGDVARRDADGYYFIVDRIKDMYISGGENVYPAEVERVLHRHPQVLECAVVGVPDDRWGEVGCAFVLPQPGADLDTGELRAFCRQNLAAYKVPKSVVVVSDFPRTAAGKIRKNVLRADHLAKGRAAAGAAGDVGA